MTVACKSCLRTIAVFFSLLSVTPVVGAARPVAPDPIINSEAAVSDSTYYVARIQVHTAAELAGVLQRADQLFQSGRLDSGGAVVFVLHGAEGKVFLRERYDKNKSLVDLAAKLSALGVVDIRVCERWLKGQRLDKSQLLPFVDTVPYGPAEIERLHAEEHYSYF